jgi:GT2 family glycosyltransferase
LVDAAIDECIQSVSNRAPVSVVLSTFEEGPAVRATVESVLAAELTPREIILVDDGSTDRSCDGSWPAGVSLIRQPHAGIAPARNAGARAATQPTLIFLDAHCAVDRHWLRPLIDRLDKAPDAMIGPAVRDARDPGSVGSGAQIVDPLFTYRWCPVRGDAVIEVGVVPGGCMAMQRDRFLEQGGFAAFEEFGVEDVEICLRWWRAGFPLLSVPSSVVSHRFRTRPPYPPDYRAWLQNVLRTALLHLRGDLLHRCVVGCSQFASFNTAIATALSEPWIPRERSLLRRQVRDTETYFEQWSPHAFGRMPHHSAGLTPPVICTPEELPSGSST